MSKCFDRKVICDIFLTKRKTNFCVDIFLNKYLLFLPKKKKQTEKKKSVSKTLSPFWKSPTKTFFFFFFKHINSKNEPKNNTRQSITNVPKCIWSIEQNFCPVCRRLISAQFMSLQISFEKRTIVFRLVTHFLFGGTCETAFHLSDSSTIK